MRINDISITKKIVMVFATLVVVAAVSGAVSYERSTFVRTASDWTRHTYEVLSANDGMMAAMVNQETGLRGYLLAGKPNFLDPYREGIKEFEAAHAKLVALTADNPVQQARLKDVMALAKSWRETVAEAEIALMGKSSGQEQAHAMEASGLGKAAMDGIRAKVTEINQSEHVLLDRRENEAATAAMTASIATFVGLAAMIVMALAGAFALTRWISAPVRRMTACMGELARDNLDAEVPDRGRRDEIGRMADAVDVFKQALIAKKEADAAALLEADAKAKRAARLDSLTKGFEDDVSSLTQGLAGASTEMEATARSMTVVAETTNSESMGVASAAEQTSANVQTVASATEELSSTIREISVQVNKAAQSAGSAAQEAAEADQTVQLLATKSEQIGSVVALISAIANQTNLLALNATIEAARAGEAGRGFAVVAAEVKELAAQTTKATDEINTHVTEIQSVTGKAVEAIRGIAHTIEGISTVSSAIAAAMEEQGSATQEIARNVQEAAHGTEQVSSSVGEVKWAASETGSAASQVLGAARELSQHSNALTVTVGEFLANVKAA